MERKAELVTLLSRTRHVRALHLEVPGEIVSSVVDGIVESVLADGWVKRRKITTMEELDALPDGSVILDPSGLSLHKNAFTGWFASNGAKGITRDMLEAEAFPAIVLHEGSE